MANPEHLQILEQGVEAWNAWLKRHLNWAVDRVSNLSEAERADRRFYNLSEADWADLRGANLSTTDLRGANLSATDLRGANLSATDLRGANLDATDLRGANLSGANLQRLDNDPASSIGDLRGANLSGADLSGQDLCGRDLSSINLSRAILRDTNISGAILRGTNLSGVDLSGRDFSGVDLSGTNLNGAILKGVDLRLANLIGASLDGAILKGVDLRLANLIGASLDGATLTDAWLWETKRAEWSIQGIICEAVYWGKDRQERTNYGPGEFERFYADKTKVVLHYEGGMNPIEVATLPALIQRLEDTHPGCVLRLQSIEEAPGGATVTLVVEDLGEASPSHNTEQLQESAKQYQAMQRYALEQANMRQNIEHMYSQLKDAVFPLLLEDRLKYRALQSPPQTHYLTTLFLDMRGFSRLGEEERREYISMLRGLAQPMLQRGAAQYVNTWGDAIIACFADANAGLKCACQLVTVLQAAGIQTRIGMSRGKTFVRGNPLTDRLDIEGDSVNVAARLEPLAEPGEVLITEELRYHPEVKQDRFIFTRQQRSLKKAVGEQQQGDEIECYTAKLAEETQK